MNDENELLEPLATEAGQEAIVRAIRDISSLEYAVRAELAASLASAKAGEASQSAIEASNAEDKAKDWATKTDTYVEQETITIPPEQEGEEPTTETINLYSARYYASLALDAYNNMQFDSVPTENSTNMVNSGVVYSALYLKADKYTTYTKTETDNLINTRLAELVASAPAALDTLQELATALGNDPNFATTIATQLGNKADKSDTYTKTEVDTALSNVQGQLTFDNVPTANSDNPVKSGGIYTALSSKADSSSVPTKVSDLTNDSGFITGVAWNDVTSKPTFATVATSGDYSDLSNKPTIPTVPTKVSDLTNDTGFITGVSWSDVTSKPTFATVATSGDYNDLSNKPTIPSAYSLPIASANTLGGIKVGTNLSIDNNGVLSASGGGSSVTIDSTITENSTNPVTSAAIYAALEGKQSTLAFDSTPTQNSTNPVTSGGVYAALQNIPSGSSTFLGMVEDTLFSNSSGVNSGTINLSENIGDYDLITIEHRYVNNTNTDMDTAIYSAQELLSNGGAMVSGYDNRYTSFTVTSSNQISIGANANDHFYKITGIKFGYYVSGVAVDTIVTQNSNNVITSGAVYTAIQTAINSITNANGVSY